MDIDFSNPLVILGAAGAAFLIGRILFRLDSKIEDRRRNASKLAGKLDGLGLVRLPAVLIDYSVGDYSGMSSKIRELIEAIGEPAQRHAEFGKVVRAILSEQMKDPELRPGLIKFFNDTNKTTEPSPDE